MHSRAFSTLDAINASYYDGSQRHISILNPVLGFQVGLAWIHFAT